MEPRVDSWALNASIAAATVLAWIWQWHVLWIAPLLVCAGLLLVVVIQAVSFFMTDRPSHLRRLRMLETNHGRDSGWVVELNGQPVALLTAPQYMEMFWASYSIEPLVEQDAAQIRSDILWWHENLPRLVFRNREIGDVASSAFPGGEPIGDSGRITMRALYLDVEPPNLFERLLLSCRRKSEN